MKRNFFYSFAFLSMMVSQCHPTKQNSNTINNSSTFISDSNLSKHELLTDSNFLNNFFQTHTSLLRYRATLIKIYKKKGNRLLWFTNGQINDAGINCINFLKSEKIYRLKDGYWKELDSLFVRINYKEMDSSIFKDNAISIDGLLSCYLFSYADRNWDLIHSAGLQEINWYASSEYDYNGFLDSIVQNKFAISEDKKYANNEYYLFDNYIDSYINWLDTFRKNILSRALQDSIRIDTFSVLGSLKKDWNGLSFPAVGRYYNNYYPELKKLLLYFDNKHKENNPALFSYQAISSFDSLLVDITEKLLINQERSKWFNPNRTHSYIQVNIPEYKLYFYERDSLKWNTNVIVGKSLDPYKTSVFNDQIMFVVFNPYWVIPKGIMKEEVFPAMAKDKRYFKKHNLEILNHNGKRINPSAINWKIIPQNIPFTIRQLPGKNNPLGNCKFLFPNAYEIYLHDTPEKKLFNAYPRDFSHGCIRVMDPEYLADLLLCETNGICKDSILKIINTQKETYVRLKVKVPIYLSYFTTWVDTAGQLQFNDDVYAFDKRWKENIFRKNVSQAKP